MVKAGKVSKAPEAAAPVKSIVKGKKAKEVPVPDPVIEDDEDDEVSDGDEDEGESGGEESEDGEEESEDGEEEDGGEDEEDGEKEEAAEEEAKEGAFKDMTVNCKDCKEDFIFSAEEQAFFEEKGFTSPRIRCKDCTAAKKAGGGKGDGKGKGGKGKSDKGKGKGKGKGGKGGKGDSGGKGGGGVCYAFQKGECSRGEGCRFSH